MVVHQFLAFPLIRNHDKQQAEPDVWFKLLDASFCFCFINSNAKLFAVMLKGKNELILLSKPSSAKAKTR